VMVLGHTTLHRAQLPDLLVDFIDEYVSGTVDMISGVFLGNGWPMAPVVCFFFIFGV
jgi:hypothetical protein